MFKSDGQREDAETCWHFKIIFFCKMKIHLNPLLQLMPVNGMQWRSNFRISFFFFFMPLPARKNASEALNLASIFLSKVWWLTFRRLYKYVQRKKADGSRGRAPPHVRCTFIYSAKAFTSAVYKKYRVCGKKRDLTFLISYHPSINRQVVQHSTSNSFITCNYSCCQTKVNSQQHQRGNFSQKMFSA